MNLQETDTWEGQGGHNSVRSQKMARPCMQSYLSPDLLKAQLVSGKMWALKILKR